MASESFTKGLSYKVSSKNCIVKGIGNATDTDIVIPSSYEGKPVTGISNNAFFDCDSITGITIPEGVTLIGKWAFKGCTSLKKVNLPSSVSIIKKYAFFGCSSLEEVILPESLTEIKDAVFSDCISLKSITIPAGIVKIGKDAFYKCDSLESIYYLGTASMWALISFDIHAGQPLSYGGELYLNGEKAVEITIENIESVSPRAFEGCSSLTKVNISKGVSSIEDYAFSYCMSLEYVTISSDLKYIGRRAFLGSDQIETASFENPNGWYVTFDAKGKRKDEDLFLRDWFQNAKYLNSMHSNYYWFRNVNTTSGDLEYFNV